MKTEKCFFETKNIEKLLSKLVQQVQQVVALCIWESFIVWHFVIFHPSFLRTFGFSTYNSYRLSYRGQPYLFEVGIKTFRNDYKMSRSQPQNSTWTILWPQWPLNGLKNNPSLHFKNGLKSMHFFQGLMKN